MNLILFSIQNCSSVYHILPSFLVTIFSDYSVLTILVFPVFMASNLKFEQRSYIKIRTLLGIAPKEILIDLEIVYRGASLSYTTVKEWAKRFREGRESLEDEERIGRPRTAVTSSNTSEIRWRVEEDPHITVEELAMGVGISTGAVHSILVYELKVSKICSRWIPHSLTKDQRPVG